VARAVAEAAYRTGAGVRHHKSFGAHMWLAT